MASLAFKANSAMKTASILPRFGDLMRPVLPKVKNDVFLLEEGNPISGA
jgi:hypothetical protein